MAMAEMMKTMSFAYTRPLIFEGLARQLETAWPMYLWDWNNEETAGQDPEDCEPDHPTRIKD